jgi:hypothetical protein
MSIAAQKKTLFGIHTARSIFEFAVLINPLSNANKYSQSETGSPKYRKEFNDKRSVARI